MGEASALFRVTPLLAIASLCGAAEQISYQADVAPLFERYCVGCHEQDYAEGDVALDSYAAVMAGGQSGLAITPGSGSSSRLLLMVSGQLQPKMPPEGEAAPSVDEIALIAEWIKQGAPGPDGPPPLKKKPNVPEIATQSKQPLAVTAVRHAPHGDLLAVASYGKVELRRVDGSIAATLTGPIDKVNALEFSRDGSQLLVASGTPGAYGAALLYSTESGELLREYVGLRDALYAVAFSPDRSLIAAAGYDHDIVVWDAATGEVAQLLEGHNGAILDLGFSPDGDVLVSASADETVKVWNPVSGERLDTLSQPEGEVSAVNVTPDGEHVVAVSADNRLRAWRLVSRREPAINPMVATLFVDESSLIDVEPVRDGSFHVVLSRAGNLKVVRSDDWSQAAALDPLDHPALDLCVHPDGERLVVATTAGLIEERELPPIAKRAWRPREAKPPVYLDLGPLSELAEKELLEKAPPSHVDLPIARGARVTGTVAQQGERDHYRWMARAGEQWAIDADATTESKIDPMVTVLDSEHEPVLRVRLQAIQDSYYTFRGKNSSQINDFRIFNWADMQLNQYLYSSGEVVRLWMHPRGPDSGFVVYPGEGGAQRWTYFGTTGVTHALGEPAYVVRPLEQGEPRADNGLPVFDVEYKNDDDPQGVAKKNSRLLFSAPQDGHYVVRVEDARGFGGDQYKYRLAVRPATPSFTPRVAKINKPLLPGAGREFALSIDRIDGFSGGVTFEIAGLPDGVHTNLPVTVEPGQRLATGLVWLDPSAAAWETPFEPEIVASADILGTRVERHAGTLGQLVVGERPGIVPVLSLPSGGPTKRVETPLRIRRGETAYALVSLQRQEGDDQEVRFGNEFAARNASHGVYVDNIGLNGLLVRKGENDREFALTADPTAVLGRRDVFLTGQVSTPSGSERISTNAITVEVLP